jgi:G3E family GTPase
MTNSKAKTDLYLITGFLGSGKTTLLKNFLKNYSEIKVGVIVNEFGKIGIDGKLVERENMDLIEINNGSIFCSCLENAFIKGLIDLLDYNLDKIFVETSGLSDPTNLDKIIEETKSLSDKEFNYKGSICIVNANNFLKLINTSQAVERQILFSDLIIINKNDLVDKQKTKEVKNKIEKLNQFANIIVTNYCNFNLNSIDNKIALENDSINENRPKETINKKNNRPFTYSFQFKGTISKDGLGKFFDDISDKIFRAKGFVKTEEGWYYVDLIGEEVNYNLVKSKRDNSELVMLSTEQADITDWVQKKWEYYK